MNHLFKLYRYVLTQVSAMWKEAGIPIYASDMHKSAVTVLLAVLDDTPISFFEGGKYGPEVADRVRSAIARYQQCIQAARAAWSRTDYEPSPGDIQAGATTLFIQARKLGLEESVPYEPVPSKQAVQS